ncbi:MAG: hypothetical protein Q8Q49_01855 [bacterium]|nr:hypothetical protein [bacterium]
MNKADRGIPAPAEYKDGEPRTRVSAVIYGFAHYPLNLDANRRIITEAERLLGQTAGNVFVLLEGSITPQEARTLSSLQREKGLWYTQVESDMLGVFGKTPKAADVRTYMDQLRNVTIQEILDYGLLPKNKIRINLFIRDLDDLMRQNPRLKVRDETQSQAVLNSIRADRDRYREIEQDFHSLWESGDFDRCQAAMSEIFQRVNQSRKVRDRGIVQDNLKPILEGQFKDRKGGAVLAVVGANHTEGVAEGVKWTFGKRINCEVILDLPSNHPQLKTKAFVESEQPIPNELLAQAAFESVVTGVLNDAFTEGRIVDIFADNFSIIYEAICDIVNATPEEKIRELCEQHGDIIDYVIDHPSFEHISDLLPEVKETEAANEIEEQG